ncbi:MAG: DNA-3-methyladenine glycosylase 2 family protein [Gammaproteobacteria bacterium]|nr:DNA-3-methyladenine glycosylase 2 family protein [Gammaproteobacteria bacterium]
MPALTRRRLLAHFHASDPLMAALVSAAGPFRLRPAPSASPFRHLAEAIISQQISGRAAAAIQRRFVGLFLAEPQAEDFPQPAEVLQSSAACLRSAGLSSAKVAAVQDLAAQTLAGVVPDTDTLLGLDDQTIIDRLTVVRGIGPWTVQMMLMFQLGRPDVLPVADYGVRNGFRIAYELRRLPTPGELRSHGERWAPYRSAAAWYLWRAVDLDRQGILWSRPALAGSPRKSVSPRRPAPRGAAATRRRRPGGRTR